MANLKDEFIPIKGNERKAFFNKLLSYVYVYCEIDENNRRVPIYIGKGKSDRCLSHLENLNNKSRNKDRKIAELSKSKKLGIDILAYGIDDKTALAIEAACIDLMGIDNLANEIKGQGPNVKRVPLGELSSLIMEKTIQVAPEHSGCAILINRDYRPTFGDLEVFEYTRGIWSKKMVTIAGDSKFAYATYRGVVKGVYEIHSWVPAGTQEYFSRKLDPERLKTARWEFIGRKAKDSIWKKYIGKLIDKPRSYGDPFVRV